MMGSPVHRISAREFLALPKSEPKRNKFGARRTTVDGVTFASAKEARRDAELHLLQGAGEIAELKRQQPFPLKVNGKLVCTYIADWVYRDKSGDVVVEDAKGHQTREFKIKSKLFSALTGMEIKLT